MKPLGLDPPFQIEITDAGRAYSGEAGTTKHANKRGFRFFDVHCNLRSYDLRLSMHCFRRNAQPSFCNPLFALFKLSQNTCVLARARRAPTQPCQPRGIPEEVLKGLESQAGVCRTGHKVVVFVNLCFNSYAPSSHAPACILPKGAMRAKARESRASTAGRWGGGCAAEKWPVAEEPHQAELALCSVRSFPILS